MAESSLWPVVVGGLLTMGGVAITSGVGFAVRLLNERAEKKKRRAEKFEELVTSVYEFDHWLDKKENVRAFGSEEKLEVSPFAKIEAISVVHFPVFTKKISELQMAVRKYEVWMSEAGMKRMNNKLAEVNEGLLNVYNPYMERRDELLSELREYARREFQ